MIQSTTIKEISAIGAGREGIRDPSGCCGSHTGSARPVLGRWGQGGIRGGGDLAQPLPPTPADRGPRHEAPSGGLRVLTAPQHLLAVRAGVIIGLIGHPFPGGLCSSGSVSHPGPAARAAGGGGRPRPVGCGVTPACSVQCARGLLRTHQRHPAPRLTCEDPCDLAPTSDLGSATPHGPSSQSRVPSGASLNEPRPFS